jgi:hypothetical protein
MKIFRDAHVQVRAAGTLGTRGRVSVGVAAVQCGIGRVGTQLAYVRARCAASRWPRTSARPCGFAVCTVTTHQRMYVRMF